MPILQMTGVSIYTQGIIVVFIKLFVYLFFSHVDTVMIWSFLIIQNFSGNYIRYTRATHFWNRNCLGKYRTFNCLP